MCRHILGVHHLLFSLCKGKRGLHPASSCTVVLYEAFQHNESTCAITSVWTASRGGRTDRKWHQNWNMLFFLAKSPFSLFTSHPFIQTSINSSPSARHPENDDGLRAHCVLQMAASCPWLDFQVWGRSAFPEHIGKKLGSVVGHLQKQISPLYVCEVLARKNN